MTRLALTVPLLLAGAVPALAQTHPGPHPHGPGHVRPDSATHAALHALLHGSWTGTLSSPRGVSSGMAVSVAQDSLRKVRVTISTDLPMRAGAARDFVVQGDKLHWTQDLSGASCQAIAVVTGATPLAPETISGQMACEDGQLTFSLRKKNGA